MIKIFLFIQVENVRMLDRYTNNHSLGTLYLTPTHFIFKDLNGQKEAWVSKILYYWVRMLHPSVIKRYLFQVLNAHIASVEKQPLTTTGSPLHIKCKNFLIITFVISKERDCHDLYVTLIKLSSPGNWANWQSIVKERSLFSNKNYVLFHVFIISDMG